METVEFRFAEVRDLGEKEEARILAMMSPEERLRQKRIRHEPTRLCDLITRRLVRETLSKLGGRRPEQWRFRKNPHGRPGLINPTEELRDLDFNISHSREMVVMAYHFGGRIGVDLEPAMRRVDHDSVARRFFSEEEDADLARLGEGARRRRFLELWVLKEAWLKADGRGLTAGLHRVVFRFDGRGVPRLTALPEEGGMPGEWEIGLKEKEGHLIGAALRRG